MRGRKGGRERGLRAPLSVFLGISVIIASQHLLESIFLGAEGGGGEKQTLINFWWECQQSTEARRGGGGAGSADGRTKERERGEKGWVKAPGKSVSLWAAKWSPQHFECFKCLEERL